MDLSRVGGTQARRTFLSPALLFRRMHFLIAGAATWPLGARAQQAEPMRWIGVLGGFTLLGIALFQPQAAQAEIRAASSSWAC
jgi:hypothetical protein